MEVTVIVLQYMQPLAIDEGLAEWHGEVPYADSIRRLLVSVPDCQGEILL